MDAFCNKKREGRARGKCECLWFMASPPVFYIAPLPSSSRTRTTPHPSDTTVTTTPLARKPLSCLFAGRRSEAGATCLSTRHSLGREWAAAVVVHRKLDGIKGGILIGSGICQVCYLTAIVTYLSRRSSACWLSLVALISLTYNSFCFLSLCYGLLAYSSAPQRMDTQGTTHPGFFSPS